MQKLFRIVSLCEGRSELAFYLIFKGFVLFTDTLPRHHAALLHHVNTPPLLLQRGQKGKIIGPDLVGY